MSLLFLLLMPSACILLQALARNLIYVYVATGCMLAAVSVSLSEMKARWWGLFLALGANATMMLYAFNLHIACGGTMSDYILSAIIIGIAMLIAIVEAIPSEKRKKGAHQKFS